MESDIRRQEKALCDAGEILTRPAMKSPEGSWKPFGAMQRRSSFLGAIYLKVGYFRGNRVGYFFGGDTGARSDSGSGFVSAGGVQCSSGVRIGVFRSTFGSGCSVGMGTVVVVSAQRIISQSTAGFGGLAGRRSIAAL